MFFTWYILHTNYTKFDYPVTLSCPIGIKIYFGPASLFWESFQPRRRILFEVLVYFGNFYPYKIVLLLGILLEIRP